MAGMVSATRFDSAPNLEMRFPPLPTTVVEVTQLVAEAQANPDTARLVSAVNRDPVVAALVLRRINSAYYGMRRLVGDIHKAVFLLGFQEVSNLVLTAGLLRLRQVLTSAEQVRIFGVVVRHGVLTAYLTQELARSADLAKTRSAFTAGLLHSIGRLVFLYNKPQDYEALWCTSSGFAPTRDAERLIFGTDHVRLGARAAEHWNLPKDVAALIGGYAAPHALTDPDLRNLGRTLALAAVTAEAAFPDEAEVPFGSEPPEGPSAALLAFADAARLSPGEAADLVESIKANAPDLLGDLLAG